MTRPLLLAASWALIAQAHAQELAILPPSAVLDGPRSSQTFVAEEVRQGVFTADLTPKAAFSIDRPEVAEVDSLGRVAPKGDGSAVLTARVGDRAVSARIVVRNSAREAPPSFQLDVLPVLTRAGCNMGACHGAAAGKNGFRLSLRGYAPEIDHDAMTRQALGRRINRTKPSESLLLLKPSGSLEHGGGIRFTEDSPDYRILADWIAWGTPRPRDDEPKLVRVEALPRAVRLSPGDSQRVVVMAVYADGRSADVTRWAKFGSTDDTVARVDDSGRVKVEGRGEAAVTVWFASLVDRLTVTVPTATPADPSIYARAARHNPIDDLNLRKLESLGIPPSPPSTDAQFLRRASLDATGTLPSAEAVRAFLADPDPNKRAKLVDRLLASPEFVDYWAYKWSDLFLVSSKKLAAPAMWAFHRAIRQAVAEDLPWDQLARRIVTARGSTLENGAANYFVLHRDPIDLTENASMAFLGMSLTCARCHNHPMEKWTQDQYYGMANLFARVSLKDGPEKGDVVVSPTAEGEVLHPRKGRPMAPQPLDGLALAIEDRNDRREAFADWLAAPENPYFDRAIVNRVWRNFFGRGLIEPEDDLRATNPPSDPDLLARLVEDFRQDGRSVKRLARRIMTSACYERSSEPVPGNEGDGKFLSHYLVRRLPAEVLLDAFSQVTHRPSDFTGYPKGWKSLQLPDAQVANAFLDSFGRPERANTCSCERSAEPSVSQALNLANGETLNAKIRDDQGAAAILASSGKADADVVETLFLSALARFPTPKEREQLSAILAEAASADKDPAARRHAVEDLFWAVLTSKEFLFNL